MNPTNIDYVDVTWNVFPACPCCGSYEWKTIDRWAGYGMSCYECLMCGYQVVE